MLNKSSSSKKIDEAVAKSINFELTVADLARRGERRAWQVTFAAITMTLLLASVAGWRGATRDAVLQLIDRGLDDGRFVHVGDIASDGTSRARADSRFHHGAGLGGDSG